mgnify:FL=1|jgi:hypothetical protein
MRRRGRPFGTEVVTPPEVRRIFDELGIQLLATRRARHLSIAALSELASVSNMTVRRGEHPADYPRYLGLHSLAKICNALGCDIVIVPRRR